MLRIIKMANKLIKRRTNINHLHPITSKRRQKEKRDSAQVKNSLDMEEERRVRHLWMTNSNPTH
jgi:hypothetical protein